MNKLPEKPPKGWDEIAIQTIEKIHHDPAFKKMVTEYNTRYLAWDDLTYRISDPDKRMATWAMMKMVRAVRYETVPFPPLNLKYSTVPEISRNLHIFDQYLSGTIRIHNKTIRLEQSYIINSLMEESIASSILEGAVTARKVAKKMLRKGREPRNISEQMVINNYRAMRFIQTKKDTSLTPELILALHRTVTENTLDDAVVGRFRDNNEIVVADPVTGVVHHTPPEHTEVPGLIEALCRFANATDDDNADTFIHPIVRGIILHFLIGYIHPFEDGNGRTARSIFYWYVLSQGYWLFEYMPISRVILRSKKDYALAYLHTEYDEMDLTYFIQHQIRCIEEARKDLLTYIERKQSEQNATKAIIKTVQNINQRQADILREMMEHSDEYYTIREISETHKIVYQTARTDLLGLAEKTYIRKEKRGREFVFIFNEKCDLWNGTKKIG